MAKTDPTSMAYAKLLDELVEHSDAGDDVSTRCLGAITLLNWGWRYGDPEPDLFDPDDDPGGGSPVPIVDLEKYRDLKRAA